MVRIRVENGGRLSGTVTLAGDPEAVVAGQAAALLSSRGKVILDQVPLANERVTLGTRFLKQIGAQVETAGTSLKIDATHSLTDQPLDNSLAEFAGPLMLRQGKVILTPDFNPRLIDALKILGATVEGQTDQIIVKATNLRGTTITLQETDPQVMITLMLTAIVASNITVIKNAPHSPAVVALADLLNRMGARVHGAGERIVRIQGVTLLHGGDVLIPRNQQTAARWLTLAALTAGDLLVDGASPTFMTSLLNHLEQAGNTIVKQATGVRIIGTHYPLPTALSMDDFLAPSLIDQSLMLGLVTFMNGRRSLAGTNLDDLSPALTVLERLGVTPQVEAGCLKFSGQPTDSIKGPVTPLALPAALMWLLASLRGAASIEVEVTDQVARVIAPYLAAVAKQGIQVEISAPL